MKVLKIPSKYSRGKKNDGFWASAKSGKLTLPAPSRRQKVIVISTAFLQKVVVLGTNQSMCNFHAFYVGL